MFKYIDVSHEGPKTRLVPKGPAENYYYDICEVRGSR